MIFLALLVPVAFYLIALGFLHRRRTPLLVPGTWDVWGLLFASSGFWLLGGPAILSGIHENWRLWWVFGRAAGPLLEPGGGWPAWLVLAAGYFLAVVGVAGWQLWRARRLTSIYNIEPDAVPGALGEAAQRLGLHLVHAGALYALTPGVSGKGPLSHAITAEPARRDAGPTDPGGLTPGGTPGPPAVAEVDPFPLMRHVTLRWHSGDPLLRRQVEEELARVFRSTPTPEHDLGGWLQVLGLGLLCFCSLGCVTLQILTLFLGR